jgi:hypothetical protein
MPAVYRVGVEVANLPTRRRAKAAITAGLPQSSHIDTGCFAPGRLACEIPLTRGHTRLHLVSGGRNPTAHP